MASPAVRALAGLVAADRLRVADGWLGAALCGHGLFQGLAVAPALDARFGR